MTFPRFSIIIPAFNAEAFLGNCLRSCIEQDIDPRDYEILVVDDGSADGTFGLACALSRTHRHVHAARLPRNAGPGVARNLGLQLASGEWILFVDSDDLLVPQALRLLGEALDDPGRQDCDALGFDWRYQDDPEATSRRRDHLFLAQQKAELVRRYLSLHMDGAVTFTAVRANFLRDHGIGFAAGYHEDVDVLFRIYAQARRVAYLDRVLYAKQPRAGSITRTMSAAHIAGFVRAWLAIGEFVRVAGQTAWMDWHGNGSVGVVATRLREILRDGTDPAAWRTQMLALHDGWQVFRRSAGEIDLHAADTQYYRMTRHFVAFMADPVPPTQDTLAGFAGEIRELAAASWSCTDLHHSVFLAPDEVRTCCKRFFVDGQRRGDVALLRVSDDADITATNIAAAKESLHRAINRGDETACAGCPFLEFKPWGPIDKLRVRYLSLEYHSVCNLRCTYCDENYFGGQRPQYDPKSITLSLIETGNIDKQATIVWGGGEPVIDRDFPAILDALATHLPDATQRVLTNAVRFSPHAARQLAAGRIHLTTSLDAGTPETFTRIRGRNRLAGVLANLRRYAAENAAGVTIKYIFTEGNESLEEVDAFVAAVRNAGLTGCNFQISHDFKSERIAEPTLLCIAALHGKLTEAGCAVVFLDDLLRQRMTGLPAETEQRLRDKLAAIQLKDVLVDAQQAEHIVLWGAGWQAKFCLEKSSLFRTRKPAFVVDSTPPLIGQSFMGLAVRDPAVLATCDFRVLISAAQAYPIIHEKFRAMGLPQSRLVTQMVI